MRNPSCRVGVGFPTSSLASSALGQRSRHQTLAVDSWQMLFLNCPEAVPAKSWEGKGTAVGLKNARPTGLMGASCTLCIAPGAVRLQRHMHPLVRKIDWHFYGWKRALLLDFGAWSPEYGRQKLCVDALVKTTYITASCSGVWWRRVMIVPFRVMSCTR